MHMLSVNTTENHKSRFLARAVSLYHPPPLLHAVATTDMQN